MKTAYPIGRVLPRGDFVQDPGGVWHTISLRDLSDCLIEAYDAVALRAAALMRESGLPPLSLTTNRELWTKAERETLSEITVDLHVTGTSVSALASLPDFSAREITLGIEPRWMVVFARRIERDRLRGQKSFVGRETHYAFCSLELPEEVDPVKCCAVFHDGVLGVRVLRRFS